MKYKQMKAIIHFNLKILSVILLSLLLQKQYGFSQPPSDDWHWSRSGGGLNVLAATYEKSIVNSNNELIVCGQFKADMTTPMIFDGSDLEIFSAGSGITTSFLGKYSDIGALLWVQSYQSGQVYDVYSAVDHNNNIYLAGNVKSFFTIDTIDLIPANPDDPFIFLIKFDNEGNLIWAKIITETHPSSDSDEYYGVELKGIDIDPLNNIILLGHFTQPSVTIEDSILTQIGYYDVFLSKIDEHGAVTWLKGVGDSSLHDFAHEIVTDSKGSIYITHTFQPVDIIVEPIKTVVSKVSFLGDIVWRDTINPGDHPNGFGYLKLHISSDGYIYSTGFYRGSFSIQGHLLPLGDHLMIAKQNTDGDYEWVKTTGQTSISDPHIFPVEIRTDAENNIYTGGTYVKGITGSTTDLVIDTFVLLHQGERDVYFIKLDHNGNALYAQNIGENQNDGLGGMAVDNGGNIYLTGYFNSNSLSFNDIIQNNLSLSGGISGTNFFVAKFGPTGSTGINDKLSSVHFDIFPNPANTTITIQCELNILNISLYNSLGRCVIQRAGNNNNNTSTILNVDNLPSGMYIIEVNTPYGSAKKKVSIFR